MASPENGSLTGLSSAEAREFHSIFMKSTIAFTGWAFAAHVLVFMWRPWTLATETQTSSLMDGASSLAALLPALV